MGTRRVLENRRELRARLVIRKAGQCMLDGWQRAPTVALLESQLMRRERQGIRLGQ